jgi:hypothetical protein
MRNLQGKLMWVGVRPFLFAILLYLPLSATLCHAQCYYENEPGALPSATLTPSVWTAGRTYTATLTQPDPSMGWFVPPNPDQPPGSPVNGIFLAPA